jgi:hypothetical protein
VGIATNGAVLELQQAAYGRADPTGRAAQQRAFERLLVEDARAGMSTTATDLFTSVAPPPTVDPDDAPSKVPKLARPDGPTPDSRIGLRVNATADRALVGLHDGIHGPSLEQVLDRAYRVNLTLRTRADLVETEPWPQPRPPRAGATLVEESVTPAATVEDGPAPLPSRPENATRFRRATRRVTVDHRIERTWQAGNSTQTTTATVTERYAVGVVVDGSLPSLPGTPNRPVVPLYEEGGALDGPSFVDVPPKAETFLTERGGIDTVSATRVTDGRDALDRHGQVSGDQPADLREWVATDLLDVHREVRTTATSVRMGDAATGRANPAAELASNLSTRRGELVDAATRYDGAADRARVAARAAYLARVDSLLSDRSDATARANDNLTDALRAQGIDLQGRAREIMANRTVSTPDPRPAGGSLGGEDVFVPQGGPAYLDVQGVDRTDVAWADGHGTEYGLETRNVNVFTVPYGDGVDAVFDSDTADDGEETVRLHTAAVTLRAAERAAGDDGLPPRDAELRAGVSRALDNVSNRTVVALGAETRLSYRERERAVADALSTWNRTSAKALAVTDGSFVPRVVQEAGLDGQEAARARIRLRAAVAEARTSQSTHVSRDRVDATAGAVRRVAKTTVNAAAGTLVGNATERLDRRTKGKAVILPAGVPLLPTPTNWYATVNVWDVHVRGEYSRFAIRTQRGLPGATVTYVRDGGCATVDIDEDGNQEDIGCAARVDFSVRTVVLVAVPPGKTGVGDTDGQAVEDSPGWTASESDEQHRVRPRTPVSRK